ncbi:tyrosine-type recombinase/integrase [Neoaquamicrobium sediminum]|mgnify:CR=1 FL=1|uniref:Tyrosine-type integrase n=2 Tax=root TaxID=1 RepID=A0AB38ZLI8_9VIRU
MVMVELKGLHVVKAKGKTYVYAWRGGPPVKGVLGTPEFQAAYNEAVAAHRLPDSGKFRSVVNRYKASPDYAKLAASTKKNWARWLDRISDYFGDLSVKQFDRPEKIRPIIRRWRGQYSHQPRTADYGMQVLSRVLSFAVDPLGAIASNPCEGIKQLYSNNRAEIIWTEDDIAQLRAKAPEQVMFAVDLAAATGLRVSDLLRLSWSHIQDDAIVISTGKSRHRREAVIPLYDDLRALLERIPRRSTAVLTNSRKRPWTADGLNSSFAKAMDDAGLKERDLHFHDLRGTAATRFYLAGLSERVIAEIMGWEEDYVARIIRRYVDRKAALKATIRQLSEARK